MRAFHESAGSIPLTDERTQQYVERLAGGIAHDFNNLLTAIIGHADLLSEYFASGDPRATEVAAIRRAAEHASTLTRRLQAFSRTQRLQPTVLNLNDIVARARRILVRLLGEHIELQTFAASPLSSVEADATQIEQVLLTLALNARDAMPAGGELTLRTENVRLDRTAARRIGVEAGDYVELTVADSGIGMDSAVQAHLFEPFFTTKVRKHGTGLGLATVYGTVRQSGGHIRVESEAGAGTRFSMLFPATPEPALPPPSARGSTADRGSGTILLVEDDDAVRALIGDVLGRRGYHVLPARDGNHALAIADSPEASIDLLITDVVMPGPSGPAVARELRARRPQLKVLFVSGYTEDATVTIESADQGFLQKPFTPDTLARKVRTVLIGAKT